MMSDIEGALGLVIEGIGSDGDNTFYIELSDGSELEFSVNDKGDLELFLYSGFLDS